MPTKRGRYYLGRIIKLGNFNQEKLLHALEKPATVMAGQFGWTITSLQMVKSGKEVKYAFGKLSKFKVEGTVSVVDQQRREEIEKSQPNLLSASSPFVYIPEHSGIAYLHVWNEIQQEAFVRRFAEIMIQTYENFFVDCHIEAVTDLRSFALKLKGLEKITELSARINPPNPLFGPLWKSLKDYLQTRQAIEMKVAERAAPGRPINTQLQTHIAGILDHENTAKKYEPEKPPAIGDAAVLMAADGYGSGKVVGEQDGAEVVLRTSEAIKHFTHDKEPTPESLYEKALEAFESVKKERRMKH